MSGVHGVCCCAQLHDVLDLIPDVLHK
jgi:hypothetical protein